MTLIWAKTIKLLGGTRGGYVDDVGKDSIDKHRVLTIEGKKNDKVDIIKIKTLFIKRY